MARIHQHTRGHAACKPVANPGLKPDLGTMQQAKNGEVVSPNVEGPAYATRAIAMCHLAVYDAYVGISKDAATYLTYPGLPTVRKSAHQYAAVRLRRRAACRTLKRPPMVIVACQRELWCGAHCMQQVHTMSKGASTSSTRV